MNLYLISQDENDGWDTYDSAVVCTPDEETARNMDPSTGKPMKWKEQRTVYEDWCSGPDKVKVEYLGIADPGTKQGVLCASFNAG